MTTLPNKELLRVDEVARYFSVTERTVRAWIEEGRLEAERVVGTIRIRREAVFKICVKIKEKHLTERTETVSN